MNELAQYLIDNIIVDFEGEVTTDIVKEFLRKEDNAQSRALLQKIIEEKDIEDLMLTLADCLTAEIKERFLTAKDVKEHLNNYSEA